MKIKRIITSLFTLLCTVPLLAQSDPQASEILKGVSAQYKTYTSLKAMFSVTTESTKDKTSQTQQGTIHVKGDKYKLEISNQDVYFDGKNVWTHLKDSKEVQITEPNTKEGAVTPVTIFTIYEKGFISQWIEDKTESGKTVQVIELTPTDKTKNYFKIRITVDKAGKTLVNAKVFEKNGNRTTYSVKQFTPNVQIPEGFFTFNKTQNPGVEVIDLR